LIVDTRLRLPTEILLKV